MGGSGELVSRIPSAVDRLALSDPTSQARPHTAPVSTENHSSSNSALSKYEMLENRPCKPLHQTLIGSSTHVPVPLSPKLGSRGDTEGAQAPVGRPVLSESAPQAHQRKRSASPVTRAPVNFTDDFSDGEAILPQKQTPSAAELKTIKPYLLDIKAKGQRLQQKQNVKTSAQQVYSPDKYATSSRKVAWSPKGGRDSAFLAVGGQSSAASPPETVNVTSVVSRAREGSLQDLEDDPGEKSFYTSSILHFFSLWSSTDSRLFYLAMQKHIYSRMVCMITDKNHREVSFFADQ